MFRHFLIKPMLLVLIRIASKYFFSRVYILFTTTYNFTNTRFFQILTPSITFQCRSGDTAARTLRVRHTLPIGCSGVASCEIDLKVMVQGVACQRLGVPGDSCGVKIQSTTAIGTDIEVVLTCASTGIYFQSSVMYNVYLKTETLENMIWRNYIEGPISVSNFHS